MTKIKIKSRNMLNALMDFHLAGLWMCDEDDSIRDRDGGFINFIEDYHRPRHDVRLGLEACLDILRKNGVEAEILYDPDQD